MLHNAHVIDWMWWEFKKDKDCTGNLVMDCRICRPECKDENVCQNCSYELYPLIEYLVNSSGDTTWRDHNALLYFDLRDVKEIDAFLCGGFFPYRSTPSLFATGSWQLELLDEPIKRHLSPRELKI